MSYQNPVLRGLNPDPSICRAGTDYYMVTSTMFFYPGVPVYHSRDMIHWRMIGHCLTRESHFQLDKCGGNPMIYAPTLRYHDGVFYMITTNVHGGGNFYVTATDPAGPWSDPIVVDQDVFDPSLMFDFDGKVYYTRRGHLHEKDVVQAEIDIRTGKLLTELRSIGVGMVSDDAEGPHLYHIGDWYYLMQAEGGSRFLHMETVGRSLSPWGPFEPCPSNPILAQHEAWWHPIKSTGHADLIEAHDGSWWAVYLGTRHSYYDALTILGRETFLAPVAWVEGWPVMDKTATRTLVVDVPTLPQLRWPDQPARDDFDTDKLRPEWTHLSMASAARVSLRERQGWLRLSGATVNLREAADCAFAGIRQADIHFQASTVVDFEPRLQVEEAGITVFQRHDFHYDLLLTCREGERRLVLRKCVGDMVVEAAQVPAPDGVVTMWVMGDDRKYTFGYGTVAGSSTLGTAQVTLISAEVVETWTGAFIGLFAAGEGAVADFDWFEYHPHRITGEASKPAG